MSDSTTGRADASGPERAEERERLEAQLAVPGGEDVDAMLTVLAHLTRMTGGDGRRLA